MRTGTARLGPLYLAGFTTALGAHGVAAALGTETDEIGLSVVGLGLILALYDIAEVVLKPVFGALSDRVGVKPVIVGGLVVFAAASLIGVFAATPALLAIARLAQGAAASAFSPASSSAVARMVGPDLAGRYFGRYGSWKGLGYAAGPLLGAGLIVLAGLPALFAALAVLALAAAVWALVAMPVVPVLPKERATLRELVRQSTAAAFVGPVLLLAVGTGALGVAVGFLPLIAARVGADPVLGMASVSVLAVVSAVVQPRVGRVHDTRPRHVTPLVLGASLLLVLGLALVALVPSAAAVFVSAAAIGLGVGVLTPLGFARLAATTPAARMGRTMGSAELGREVGDAGGPILVGVVAGVATLPVALAVMAIATAVVAGAGATLTARSGPAPREPWGR